MYRTLLNIVSFTIIGFLSFVEMEKLIYILKGIDQNDVH